MTRLLECVPNFSEGRRPEVIDAICRAIASSDGVTILDREMDADHNRAVVTFVGEPESVVEGSWRGIVKAAELIDMRAHRGEHPRMGATDVCPFVPLEGVTVEDAVTYANQLAERVGRELEIPVYLYEEAARTTARKNLATIRKGEYEAIRDEIETIPERAPDYGPRKIHLKAGATAIGVRFPLVAFNVYLGTSDVAIAQKVASAVRFLEGGLRYVKALGFYIKERQQAQVSMNLTNYTKTPIFRVFDMIKAEAARYGVNVTSSEIVGLVPNRALLDVADYYLQLERFTPAQVLENKLAAVGAGGAGGAVSAGDFFASVASSTPTPGGGSVAAAAGALAAALASMVCRLTVTKKKYEGVRDELMGVCDKSEKLRRELTELIEKDGQAFDKVMAAYALAKGGDPEMAARASAISEASKGAALVPMTVVERAQEVLDLAAMVAEKGNRNSITDAGVSALMALAALEGAAYNARINLLSVSDAAFCDDIRARLTSASTRANATASRVREMVNAALTPPTD